MIQDKNNYPDRYETHNLDCAAYLVAKGFRIKEVETIEGNSRKVFHFPPEALEDATKFWNDEALINPREMCSALREVKTKIYNPQNNV